jgi:hypothetical protein
MRTKTPLQTIALLAVACAVAAGCASAEIGTRKKADLLDDDRRFGAFAGLDGMSTYDGRIVTAGVFGSDRPGEWLNLGVWPVFDVGLGPIGLRGQVLPLEFGIGALWYTPEPRAAASEAARTWHSRQEAEGRVDWTTGGEREPR